MEEDDSGGKCRVYLFQTVFFFSNAEENFILWLDCLGRRVFVLNFEQKKKNFFGCFSKPVYSVLTTHFVFNHC